MSVRGITLITLVITIILLIILAGVAINLSIGENGLFSKAKQAKGEYLNAQTAEEEQLNELYARLASGDLPENTPETDAGTMVKMPNNWYTSTPNYVSAEDGSIVKKTTIASTVYAVSDGNNNTVPVPIGFYYVGGNLNTGVIISDNSDDRYGYNPETKKENDTTLDKTTYAYTTSLHGNQFVWLPCSTSEYVKCNKWNGTEQKSGTLASAYWDTTTPASELTQIEKYGGFYVARYEAGLASDIPEFTETQQHTGSNPIYNKEGVPQSKAGVIPWMFIDWDHSKANAESMYNNAYVSSGLITGTQWDVMLKKMVGKTIGETTGENEITLTEADLTNSSKWGNYKTNSVAYTGRLAKATNSSSTWYLAAFGNETSGSTTTHSSNTNAGDLLTTGASKTTKVYNLFDVAGNLWEWTEETSYYGGNTSTQYRVIRGGGCHSTPSGSSACDRGGTYTVSDTGFHIGFRAVLYMK